MALDYPYPGTPVPPSAATPSNPFVDMARALSAGLTPMDVRALGYLAEAMAIDASPLGNVHLAQLATTMNQMTTEGRQALVLALKQVAFEAIDWHAGLPYQGNTGGVFAIPPHVLRPKPVKD